MNRFTMWMALGLWAGSVEAVEYYFDFSKSPVNETPAGYRNTVAGVGKPGEWKIILDEVPSLMPPLSDRTPNSARRPVLAQLAKDTTDEHFPLLIYEDQTFGDFTLTTSFKTVSGEREQMAGLAFRIQDEKNYYVVRASSLGSTLRFYAVVNGVRNEPRGTDLPIAKGVWHELSVECKGNLIRIHLDGKEPIPPLTDLSFTTGKIGFWTKSDSVSYFADTKINYVPREPVAQALLQEQLKKFPRLLGIRIFSNPTAEAKTRVIASDVASELGKPAATPLQSAAESAIAKDMIYCSSPSQTVTITLPLHDKNGEVMGALQLKMKSFPGQTHENAIVRAMPVVKAIEARARTKADLVQ